MVNIDENQIAKAVEEYMRQKSVKRLRNIALLLSLFFVYVLGALIAAVSSSHSLLNIPQLLWEIMMFFGGLLFIFPIYKYICWVMKNEGMER